LIFFFIFFSLRKISLFQNTKKKFGGKKINLAKKVGPLFFIIVDYFLALNPVNYSHFLQKITIYKKKV
jgi:hypothetical protein